MPDNDNNNDPDWAYNNVEKIARDAVRMSPVQFSHAYAMAPASSGNANTPGGSPYTMSPTGSPYNRTPGGSAYAKTSGSSGHVMAPAGPSNAMASAGSGREEDIEEALARMAGLQEERKKEFWRKMKTQLSQRLAAMGNAPDKTIPLYDNKYRMEKLDPKHMMGDLLLIFLEEYDKRMPPLGFMEWLNSLGEFERVMLCQGKLFKPWDNKNPLPQDEIRPSFVKEFCRGVIYLDARTRRSYRVVFDRGRLMQNGVPFDTSQHRSGTSGSDWAIFVFSSRKWLYAASHAVGHFHHSSFLSGAPVLCAGEMRVRNGQLLILTAKTGHYKTQKANFLSLIEYFAQAHHIDPSTYKVRVYKNGSFEELMTARDFVTRTDKYEVWKMVS